MAEPKTKDIATDEQHLRHPMSGRLRELHRDKASGSTGNTLFPIFLKSEQLHTLVIGGGEVGLEKLNALLANSPKARVTVVAREILPALHQLAANHRAVHILQEEYRPGHLEGVDVVISAVNDKDLSARIRTDARALRLLYNAADKPDLCDFYLGSVVKKGDLKLAISTNGKSPTLAKRLREWFDAIIPLEIDHNLTQLERLRSQMRGDFADKVKTLNELTRDFKPEKPENLTVKKGLIRLGLTLVIMLTGHLLFSLIPLTEIGSWTAGLWHQIDQTFLWFLLGGFIAQLIDGALGMAYGVSATTFLLSLGVSPAVASMSVHTSEIFTSGVSGIMHLRFGNVNNRLFRTIVIPGVIGSITGAYILVEFDSYNHIIRPLVATYTLFLGVVIVAKTLRRRTRRQRVKKAGWLAALGGFLDAVGGGGWGPVVASTLIARGKNPRVIIGSVNLAEFFVSIASSFTLITLIGSGNWQPILGLILGGCCAAPLSALLTQRLNLKAMMLLVGIIVIITSTKLILQSLI
ncbi:MAG TPA: TSUP family transporter [Luteibaculaceae bacterium]|nr:TSUP family transporter [Luteibaculaceae bacterium]